jgi:hypothetical protein
MLRPFSTPTQTAAQPAQRGAERRRERRYQVDLPGAARIGSETCVVLVSDLSASGALVTAVGAGDSFRAGADIVLLLDEFGPIEARIVHEGDGFYGLSFLHPHRHRDRLAAWLRQEVGGP